MYRGNPSLREEIAVRVLCVLRVLHVLRVLRVLSVSFLYPSCILLLEYKTRGAKIFLPRFRKDQSQTQQVFMGA